MSPRLRLIILAALLVTTSTFLAIPAATHANYDGSEGKAPSSGSCCLPSQVSKWEALLPMRPLNPALVVGVITRLKLINFQVLASRGTVATGTPNGYNTIRYFFGSTPPTAGSLMVRPRPCFVAVTERIERRKSSGISISKVLPGSRTAAVPAGYESPLMLVATLDSHFTVFIESNIPRQRLRQLGQLLTSNGRAPGSRSPLQALSLCEPRSVQPYVYPHEVIVSGYLRVQRWKPSDPEIYGVLFYRGNVPVGAEYNARWVTYGGLVIDVRAALFRYYLSLPNAHPAVAWRGTLRCSGAWSVLHAEQLSMPAPISGR